MREAQSEMNTQWTFKGVKRVADSEPVPAAKQEAPVLSFGKKTTDSSQPTIDRSKDTWARKKLDGETKA